MSLELAPLSTIRGPMHKDFCLFLCWQLRELFSKDQGRFSKFSLTFTGQAGAFEKESKGSDKSAGAVVRMCSFGCAVADAVVLNCSPCCWTTARM
jgi:hypothetical protein